MRRLLTALLVLSGLVLAVPAIAKDAPQPGASEASELPQKVRDFVSLMDDPQVRAWMSKQIAEHPVAAAPGGKAADDEENGLDLLVARFEKIRSHFAALAEVVPTLPQQADHAGALLAGELGKRNILRVLWLLALFVGLGFVAEWVFWRAIARFRARLDAMELDTLGRRLAAIGMRFCLGIGVVVSFALASVGTFLALDWPQLMKRIVLGYLVAFLVWRLAVVIGRILLAPGGREAEDAARFRIMPMTTDAARYWSRRLALIVGWLAFGWVTVSVLSLFGFSREALQLFAYALGIVLLGLSIEAAWRAPLAADAEAVETAEQRQRRRGRAVGVSLYFVLLWLLWVASAMPLFWVTLVLGALPAAIRLTDRAVNHVLRPPGREETGAVAASVAAVCLERGLRSLLVVGAALWLAHVWSVDVADIATQDTLATRIMRAILIAIIVFLTTDFIWSVLRTLIDAKAEEANRAGEVTIEEARRRARLRTLLPIMRNMLFVFILVLAAMMGLASLGVQIGPLIASAGVVGVAVGFGAQTVVKDIISGIFYLLDDAFRIGEYIQSGNYRGEVESFSLRSVKLRHQNGPLYTVPFGVLGAIQNMSRDWAITKLTVGVTYDTDIEKARKIVKKLGQDLAADPELAAGIMEPLKMQGVQEFGDFAVQLRLKMKTRPGDVQFTARRRALAMIKKAFDANGIKFAYPTVQVAGGTASVADDALAASVAQKGLELMKKPAASA